MLDQGAIETNVSNCGPLDRKIAFRRAHAYTLFEIVIAVAIMAVIGSLLIPVAASYLGRQNVAATANSLKEIAQDLFDFRTAITQSPKRLSHLSTPITALDTTSCTGTAPTTTVLYATNSSKWTGKGPFYDRVISRTGWVLPIGTANDVMVRTSNNTTAGFLNITIPSVSFEDAVELNTIMDGPSDANQVNRSNTTGGVQWGVPSAAEQVTLTYSIPVGNTC